MRVNEAPSANGESPRLAQLGPTLLPAPPLPAPTGIFGWPPQWKPDGDRTSLPKSNSIVPTRRPSDARCEILSTEPDNNILSNRVSANVVVRYVLPSLLSPFGLMVIPTKVFVHGQLENPSTRGASPSHAMAAGTGTADDGVAHVNLSLPHDLNYPIFRTYGFGYCVDPKSGHRIDAVKDGPWPEVIFGDRNSHY